MLRAAAVLALAALAAAQGECFAIVSLALPVLAILGMAGISFAFTMPLAQPAPQLGRARRCRWEGWLAAACARQGAASLGQGQQGTPAANPQALERAAWLGGGLAAPGTVGGVTYGGRRADSGPCCWHFCGARRSSNTAWRPGRQQGGCRGPNCCGSPSGAHQPGSMVCNAAARGTGTAGGTCSARRAWAGTRPR